MAKDPKMFGMFEHLRPFLKDVFFAGVPGDVIELGVYEGATFLPMAAAAANFGRVSHAVDSFQGLAQPSLEDWPGCVKGKYSVNGATTLREKIRVNGLGTWAYVHEGWIPNVLHALRAVTFCFVHLDLDHFMPTLQALRFIWPRLMPGGMLFVHDYVLDREGGAMQAYEEWRLREGLHWIPYPATQHGYIIKGR